MDPHSIINPLLKFLINIYKLKDYKKNLNINVNLPNHNPLALKNKIGRSFFIKGDIMDIKQLNEELRYVLNEMAQISGKIEVNNEDIVNSKGIKQEKFPHFHWMYKRKIHFKFATRCPKNIKELRKLIAFNSEQKLITDGELSKLLKDLKSSASENVYKGLTVYDAGLKHWKFLHPDRHMELIEF